MYDIVEHVAELPANVIEDVFHHLLVIEVRPLTFSLDAAIKDLATRRVWRKVVVWGEAKSNRFNAPAQDSSYGLDMLWDDFVSKVELLWKPPRRIHLLDIRVEECFEPSRVFGPEVVEFINSQANNLAFNMEFIGDFNGEEENGEMLALSALPRLSAFTNLRHVHLLHEHVRIPAIEGWDRYIELPEGLKLFLYFDDYMNPEFDVVEIPLSVTSIALAFWSEWPEYIPKLPEGLRRLVLYGTRLSAMASSLELYVPQGLQELRVCDDYDNDIWRPFPRSSYDQWPKVAVSASLIASLPPGLQHNLVAE